MVYSNKFVMCILVDGHPQQELANGVVKLPFGTEYSLRFRNKNNRRAVVKIFIDGENVSGGGYIIPANDHVDIKRHWDKDRTFKFVDLDSPEAVDAGKNGPNPDKEKGLVEAHFYLEKESSYFYSPYVPHYREEHHHHHHHHHDHYHPRPWNPYPIRPLWIGASDQGQYKTTCDAGDAQYGCKGLAPAGGTSLNMSDSTPTAENMKCSTGGDDIATFKRISTKRSRAVASGQSVTCSAPPPAPELRDGCTVEGGSTGQRFSTTYIDLEDSYTTLKVFLQGFEDEEPVQNISEAPKKYRKTNKDNRLDDLEAENERLRKELAELENQKLKKELEKAKSKKPPKKRTRKKKDEPKPEGE